MERRARQIQNVACLIKDAAAYDAAQEKMQALLAEAERLREKVPDVEKQDGNK